jgi:hypothetical protein
MDQEADQTQPTTHPIASLDGFDNVVAFDRGAYLGLVIASPLKDDEVSRARLRKKIELYVGYFLSQEYRDRHGCPGLDRSRIYVSVHAGSDASMLKLIETYSDDVRGNGITLIIKLTTES